MPEEKPIPENLKKFIASLQSLGDKMASFTAQQRRKDGWIPPEEIAGTRAMLKLIYEKTSDIEEGKERAVLEAINKVLGDYLKSVE